MHSSQPQLLSLVAAWLLCLNLAQAQEDPEKSDCRPFWVQTSLLIANADEGDDIGGTGIGLVFNPGGKWLIAMAHHEFEKRDYWLDTELDEHRLLEARTTSMSVGYRLLGSRWYSVNARAGLSFTQGIYRGGLRRYHTEGSGWFNIDVPEYYQKEFDSFGIPLAVDALLHTRYGGIQLGVFGDLNEHSTYGISLGVVLGNLGF